GYYLETIFPKLNVRFIAITDDFDSTRKEDVESLAVPIKNMVNALYAKDMSKKILAAKEAQRKRGTVKIARAPYGYHVSEDGMSLETDLETAPYVRMIFQWYLLGVGLYEIARRLNLLGIATPGQRAELDVLTVPLEETKWAPSAVQKILNNPSYTGDLVMGRYKQSLYKGEKRRYTEPEEWFVQKDTHEAMVARDDYAELEKRGKEVSREWKEQRERYDADREKYQDSFAGMVRCADCGGSMHYVRYTHDYTDNEKMGAYYVCRSSKRTALCSDHKIEENLLKIVVMDQIQVLIQAMCSQKQLLRRIQDGAGGSNPMQDAVMKIRILERNIAQTEERSAKLYEHYAEGILDAEDFQTMKERYAQEVQTMKGELQEAQESKRRLDRKIQRYTDMASRVEIYLGDRSFHEELVKELVDYVEVSASGAIHVCFRYADEFQAVAALTGSVADGKG
ncbi:MAG: recombinase family protein, partial [Lachnospiraceae bacterium]|nr:recombinase family protein [Lachnospiraceae bacterium]